jgi:hypothetical protein
MSKAPVAGSIFAALALGWAGLVWSGSGVLVAERWEEPETPALAVLLHGQWADGSRVNVKKLRLKCTYFTGSSLDRRVHTVDHQRGEGTFSCPSFMGDEPVASSVR